MQVILPFLSRFLVSSGFLADTRAPVVKPVEKAGRRARVAPARPETVEAAMAAKLADGLSLSLVGELR
ncbi:hypothetical protein L9G15_21130, partial [Shewanella sp. A3A]|nr:hypothetical protein [Shewanella ferrihydritica]